MFSVRSPRAVFSGGCQNMSKLLCSAFERSQFQLFVLEVVVGYSLTVSFRVMLSRFPPSVLLQELGSLEARNIQLILEMLASLSCSAFPLVIRMCRYEVVVNAVCVPVPCVLVGALCTGGIPHMSAHIVYAVVRPNAFCIGRGLVPQRYALSIFHEFGFSRFSNVQVRGSLACGFFVSGCCASNRTSKERETTSKESEREGPRQ